MSVITSSVQQDKTTPTLVLGYESTREARSIVHDVLGGGTDVTLRPAAPRSGTLDLFYLTEDTAAAAESMLAKPAIFTLTDPTRTSIAMSFVHQGALTRTLDPETRSRWTVSVGYREVTT